MADNFTYNNASGTPETGAADDVGGVKFPRAKMVWGADGVATDVSAAAPLPVVQTGAPTLPADAATETTLASVVTALAGLLTELQAKLDEGGAVSVSNFPATQPVSAVSLPLPTGAATQATLASVLAALASVVVTATDLDIRFLDAGGDSVDLGGDAATALTALQAAVDGIEALIAATNTALTTLDGRVDGVEGALTTIAGHIDTLETLIAATNTALAAATPAGTNAIGHVGLAPRTSGGLLSSTTVSAATTNATVVKASAGQVFAYQAFNKTATPVYLKLYNKATAPTVGTDTPVKVLMVPGYAAGAGAQMEWTNGVEFATGISFAITAGIAHTDNTAVTANDVVVNVDYK